MTAVVRRLLVAFAFALLLAPPAARAADLGARTLSDPGQVVSWQSANADPTGQGYNAPTEQTCTDETCDTLLLKINVPAGTFASASRPRARPTCRATAC